MTDFQPGDRVVLTGVVTWTDDGVAEVSIDGDDICHRVLYFTALRHADPPPAEPAAWKPGDRVSNGGQMGTVVTCPTCSGGGILHEPDEKPEPVSPAEPADDLADWRERERQQRVDARRELRALEVERARRRNPPPAEPAAPTAAEQALTDMEACLRAGSPDEALRLLFIWSQNKEKIARGETTWEREARHWMAQLRGEPAAPWPPPSGPPEVWRSFSGSWVYDRPVGAGRQAFGNVDQALRRWHQVYGPIDPSDEALRAWHEARR